MLIPRQVQVGKKKYRVVRLPQLAYRLRGQIQYGLKVINVGQQVGDRVFPDKEVSEIFWHEMTHAILHDMTHPLWCDESFVNAFSKRLNNAILSAKF